MQEICNEAKRMLRALDKHPIFSNDPYYRGRFTYRNRRLQILLFSKWLLLEIPEIFEKERDSSDQFLIRLNGEEIHITGFSLVHIFSRHFAPAIKDYDTPKTFISAEEFFHDTLIGQLKSLIDQIEESGKYKGQSIESISFR